MPIDVTNPNSFEDLSEKALKEFGKISTWVNNAGGLPDGTPRYLTKTSFEEFEAQINLNFTSLLFLMAVLLQRRKCGREVQ